MQRAPKIDQAIQELTTLRDEIRLNIHLAGMDVKTEWEALQPKLFELEEKLDHGTEAATKLAHDMRDALGRLRDRVRDPQVSQVMSAQVFTCSADDSVRRALQLMWDHDIGLVPVHRDGKTVGVVTDRDVAMAGYLRGGLAMSADVATVMTKTLHTCKAEQSLQAASAQMRDACVRRLLVTDDDGSVVGVLSIGDIARWAARSDAHRTMAGVAETLAVISKPRT